MSCCPTAVILDRSYLIPNDIPLGLKKDDGGFVVADQPHESDYGSQSCEYFLSRFHGRTHEVLSQRLRWRELGEVAAWVDHHETKIRNMIDEGASNQQIQYLPDPF